MSASRARNRIGVQYGQVGDIFELLTGILLEATDVNLKCFGSHQERLQNKSKITANNLNFNP